MGNGDDGSRWLLTEKQNYGFLADINLAMKTTLDLPDDVMIAVRVRAAKDNRKMKDIIADALRRDLGLAEASSRSSVRDIDPVPAGEVLPDVGSGDRMEGLLDARGHRY